MSITTTYAYIHCLKSLQLEDKEGSSSEISKLIIKQLTRQQKDILCRVLMDASPQPSKGELKVLNQKFIDLKEGNSGCKSEGISKKLIRRANEKVGKAPTIKNLVKEIAQFEEPPLLQVADLLPGLPSALYPKIFDYVVEVSNNSEEEVEMLIQQMKIFWKALASSTVGYMLKLIDITQVAAWVSRKGIPLNLLVRYGFTEEDVEFLVSRVGYVDLRGIRILDSKTGYPAINYLYKAEKMQELILGGEHACSLFAFSTTEEDKLRLIPHKENLYSLAIDRGVVPPPLLYQKTLQQFPQLQELGFYRCYLSEDNKQSLKLLPKSIQVTTEDCR